MIALVLETLGLLFAGVLAGEEFIVRYGVQPALTSLDDLPHLRARQALVRRLRVVVPALMVPTVLLAIAAVVAGGAAPGFVFRGAGLAALGAFVLFSFFGTVPINIRVNEWDAEHPPPPTGSGSWRAGSSSTCSARRRPSWDSGCCSSDSCCRLRSSNCFLRARKSGCPCSRSCDRFAWLSNCYRQICC